MDNEWQKGLNIFSFLNEYRITQAKITPFSISANFKENYPAYSPIAAEQMVKMVNQ